MAKYKVLFIAPPYMDIYKDIICEMERQNYEVDYIAEQSYMDDPNNMRGYHGFKKRLFVHPKRFEKRIKKKWTNILNSPSYNKNYDILFVVDGQSIHACVFSILKLRNKSLKSVNYLFDTTTGVYRFDVNFKYFDKVFSFDLQECKKYNIELLPIFWKPQVITPNENLYVFGGIGAFKKDRYNLFQKVSEFADRNNFSYYLKLVTFVKYFKIKHLIWKILNVQQTKMSPKEYYSDLIIHNHVPLHEFQNLMKCSEIIVDSNATHQDGLTARFMQALGDMKKIVTTNQSAKQYDFYTHQQIYLIDNIENFTSDSAFHCFVKSKLIIDEMTKEKICQFRIDNWIKRIFTFEDKSVNKG